MCRAKGREKDTLHKGGFLQLLSHQNTSRQNLKNFTESFSTHTKPNKFIVFLIQGETWLTKFCCGSNFNSFPYETTSPLEQKHEARFIFFFSDIPREFHSFQPLLFHPDFPPACSGAASTQHWKQKEAENIFKKEWLGHSQLPSFLGGIFMQKKAPREAEFPFRFFWENIPVFLHFS